MVLFSNMKVFFITGVPGIGKSSVTLKLKEKGIYTIDVDYIEGLCNWFDDDTKKVSEWHHGMGLGWYKKHKYVCNEEKLINLINNINEKTVIIVGMINNLFQLWGMFNKVFLLQCEEKTFLKRMMERENDKFGKHILERKNALSWYKNFEKETLEKGAISIDAGQPLDEVVNNILSKME